MSLQHQAAAHVGATFTVNTALDSMSALDGRCSLREAISNANNNDAWSFLPGECIAGSGPDTIVLPAGTYVLTREGAGEDLGLTGDLDIFDDVVIYGAGASTTIIDGSHLDQVFHIIGDLTGVELEGVTIQNGQLPTGGGGGAGILTLGTLTLDSSVVKSNTQSGAGTNDYGSGICVGCGIGTGRL